MSSCNKLSTNEKCCDIIRMSPLAFARFCELLRDTDRLKDNKNAIVEEQVAKFYQFLRQPNGVEVPQEIISSHRFYPHFKDCVGAIDGTHIRVKVSKDEAPRYRGRKDYTTQNVMAACGFDMRFTYVLPGWEGTVSDSSIIKNALARVDKLITPKGKFYLVDAGCMLRSGLLTPYRGVRYHLKEYSARAPENAQELLNHRHAALRNVIERTFGVLKKRFPIISRATEPHYHVKTVTEIVLACCILHSLLHTT
ncbi:hypothetical protein Dsin_029203 [Dipteronia sinensis]|uniref:DDE Tnp4 domain-containing protein n=1 Tax=Dipteronia sinensis TaxID=43782 RepID=A0AAE0DW98_9ROSI|nr:hypothetical protein Dsin_029203 [Dipteronia sinensis]